VTPPIKRTKLSDQIAQTLEREIASGRRRPGDLLPSERDLMTQFGVGRPSVREALFSLQKAGLIAVNSGSRARVIEPNHAGALATLSGIARLSLRTPFGQQHFHELRLFLETGLVRLAARRASATDLLRLENALKRNREALGDIDEFKRTDIDFHYVLAEITGNPLFPAIHTAMVDWLMDQREVTLRTPGQEVVAYKHHEQIVRAIVRHDADRAERAMSAHLRQIFRVYAQASELNEKAADTWRRHATRGRRFK
jgi:GntR family transcriptional regulator, sialic acid-inducible nan operon repressor